MKSISKILIGLSVGLGVIFSLGGFKSEEPKSSKNDNGGDSYNNYKGELLSDDGPDATDECFDTKNIPGQRKPQTKREREIINTLNETQSTLTKISNVFEFISSICSNFVRLFCNVDSSPQTRIQTTTIY